MQRNNGFFLIPMFFFFFVLSLYDKCRFSATVIFYPSKYVVLRVKKGMFL